MAQRHKRVTRETPVRIGLITAFPTRTHGNALNTQMSAHSLANGMTLGRSEF
jgi:hypothetical protein